MYNALWADWYLPGAMTALENLLFSRIPATARILDLCCGSGHVTAELVRRGYSVTGIDSSTELISLARQALPGIDFRVQDARKLQIDGKYDAVLSTFDSLNHILTLDDLRDVFIGVHAALERSGLFVFDMNLAEAYSADLRRWHAEVRQDAVGLVRGTYNPETRRAATELVWLARVAGNNLWRRQESIVEQQCYSPSEILSALDDSGFLRMQALSARDAGMNDSLALGRSFFIAWP